jgi:hypothetical protein
MMQIVHYRIIVQFQQIALEEKRHMGQATGIVGKGALAFAGNILPICGAFCNEQKN